MVVRGLGGGMVDEMCQGVLCLRLGLLRWNWLGRGCACTAQLGQRDLRCE